MTALESLGYQCDARIYPLNSYENRVYQVGLEAGGWVVVKFYRPGRWSDAQIKEEHQFALELEALEIPVAAPLIFNGSDTLLADGLFRFAVFPHLAGRAPELDDLDSLLVIGRYLGRVHLAGARKPFLARESLSVANSAGAARKFLLDNNFIPAELLPAYESLTDNLLTRIVEEFNPELTAKRQRIHGDCHLGNVLWHGGTPFFVDFDDAVMGPVVQDFWMLMSGSRDQRQAQLLELLEGYTEFADFAPVQLRLIEALRTLRIIHYSGWLARRWEDPAFPRSFPWFNTVRYWSEHILELREQQAALDEPPLRLPG
ncbi:MAG: serine/threonine protein kinase [Pseudomonadales bacterium]|nr:serine/threonine protein kinase [Pseudomonadales bacterium]MCP5345658.1 serine/threonine protein kinase [Pseudomonadales bacterium]